MTLPPRLAAVKVHQTRRGKVAWLVLGCAGGTLSNLSHAFATACEPALDYRTEHGNIFADFDQLRAAAHVLGVSIEEPKP